MKGVELRYLYRDASNYKFYGFVRLSGPLREREIRCHMLDREYFIPVEVGIPSLTPKTQIKDDHLLHEMMLVKACEVEDFDMSAKIFLSRMKSCNERGWFSARNLHDGW